MTQKDWSLLYRLPLEFRFLPLRCRRLESPSVIIPDLSFICALPLSELFAIIFSLALCSVSCTLSVGTLCRPTFTFSSPVFVADITLNLQSKDYRVCVLSLNVKLRRKDLTWSEEWAWAIRINVTLLLAFSTKSIIKKKYSKEIRAFFRRRCHSLIIVEQEAFKFSSAVITSEDNYKTWMYKRPFISWI